MYGDVTFGHFRTDVYLRLAAAMLGVRVSLFTSSSPTQVVLGQSLWSPKYRLYASDYLFSERVSETIVSLALVTVNNNTRPFTELPFSQSLPKNVCFVPCLPKFIAKACTMLACKIYVSSKMPLILALIIASALVSRRSNPRSKWVKWVI